MFSLIRLIIKIAFIILLGLLVLAFFTNPSLEDFQRQAKSKMKEQINSLEMDPTLKKVAGIGADFTQGMIDNLVHRDNYYVCSIYTVEMPGGSYKYLGAFNLFYPLQEDDPMKKFIKTINDLNRGGQGEE
jgi:hypothetical protein